MSDTGVAGPPLLRGVAETLAPHPNLDPVSAVFRPTDIGVQRGGEGSLVPPFFGHFVKDFAKREYFSSKFVPS